MHATLPGRATTHLSRVKNSVRAFRKSRARGATGPAEIHFSALGVFNHSIMGGGVLLHARNAFRNAVCLASRMRLEA